MAMSAEWVTAIQDGRQTALVAPIWGNSAVEYIIRVTAGPVSRGRTVVAVVAEVVAAGAFFWPAVVAAVVVAVATVVPAVAAVRVVAVRSAVYCSEHRQ